MKAWGFVRASLIFSLRCLLVLLISPFSPLIIYAQEPQQYEIPGVAAYIDVDYNNEEYWPKNKYPYVYSGFWFWEDFNGVCHANSSFQINLYYDDHGYPLLVDNPHFPEQSSEAKANDLKAMGNLVELSYKLDWEFGSLDDWKTSVEKYANLRGYKFKSKYVSNIDKSILKSELTGNRPVQILLRSKDPVTVNGWNFKEFYHSTIAAGYEEQGDIFAIKLFWGWGPRYNKVDLYLGSDFDLQFEEQGMVIITPFGPCDIPAGEGPGISIIVNESFVDSYKRNGNYPVIGCPINYVHTWGIYLVQNFQEMPGFGESIMIYNPTLGIEAVFIVHGDIWKQVYESMSGPSSWLGLPIGNEEAFPVSDSLSNVRQRFENGYITHLPGGNPYWQAYRYDTIPSTGTVSIATQPVGGDIFIDGSYKGYGFWNGSLPVGSYTITFGQLANYFTPASQTVTIEVDKTISIIGTYLPLITNPVSVTLITDPPGILVGDSIPSHPSPYTFIWSAGSIQTISTSSPQYSSDQRTKYAFSSWSDGGTQTHQITVPSSGATYTASFSTQYLLDTYYNPPGTGTITLSPYGPWFDPNQQVLLTAVPTSGHNFNSWSGDCSGASATCSLIVNEPKTVIAYFNLPNTTTGSIGVSIVPLEAVIDGAQWKLTNETAWRNSGSIIDNLPFGTYQAEFKPISGWNTPPNKEVTISLENVNIWLDSVSYTPQILTHTLIVLSAYPSSNVPVMVILQGNNDQEEGSTPFTRTYSHNTLITLMAPETASGNNFQKWQLDGLDFSSNQTVNLTMDSDHILAIVYYHVEPLDFIVDPGVIYVEEGGFSSFQVKLNNQPSSDIQVSVMRASGDTDLKVQSGRLLSFTSSNWDIYQTVTVSAAEDPDKTNGSAAILVSSQGIPDRYVTAIESDNDTGTNCTVQVVQRGDVNNDEAVDIKDAVTALKVLAGDRPSGLRSDYQSSGADVNGDNKIGLPEVIYILQKISLQLNEGPNLPIALEQLGPDGFSCINRGERTDEKLLILQGIVSDQNNDQVKLQIELRSASENFTGVPTHESNFVSSGSVGSIAVTNLSSGEYKWQARSMNSKEGASAWVTVNAASGWDFAVQLPIDQLCAPPLEGLVSWWSGDGDARDKIGDNHGTFLGGPTFGSGIVRQAFKFDGINDYILIPHSPSLNFETNDFTISFWVKFDSMSGEQVLIEKLEKPTEDDWSQRKGWTLTKLENNVIRFAGPVLIDTASILDVAVFPVTKNEWTYVTLTRENDNFTLYWNGAAVGSASYHVDLNSNASLKIGRRGNEIDTPGDPRGFYLNGLIDEVSIYNRSLSLSDILSIYNTSRESQCKTETKNCIQAPASLVGWWPGDGDSTDIVDGNNGTLKGGATFGSGLVTQAFQLDGIDGFVMVPHTASLNFGVNDFTTTFWVKFNSTTGEQVLIEKYIEKLHRSTTTGWTLSKSEDNNIQFATRDGIILNSQFPSITEGRWTFITIARNDDKFVLYWDGVVVSSTTFTTNLDSDTSLKIGHRGNPDDTPGSLDSRGLYLNGLIDEIDIYNRTLTPSEIQIIFDAHSDGKCKDI